MNEITTNTLGTTTKITRKIIALVTTTLDESIILIWTRVTGKDWSQERRFLKNSISPVVINSASRMKNKYSVLF